MTDYDGATCACGSAWFRLEPPDPDTPAAVTLDERGVITGFSGQPVCIECGKPWQPTRDRMRLVR